MRPHHTRQPLPPGPPPTRPRAGYTRWTQRWWARRPLHPDPPRTAVPPSPARPISRSGERTSGARASPLTGRRSRERPSSAAGPREPQRRDTRVVAAPGHVHPPRPPTPTSGGGDRPALRRTSEFCATRTAWRLSESRSQAVRTPPLHHRRERRRSLRSRQPRRPPTR
ncbi:translation initiation factor IF-2-like [Amphibalanus amphitrite]|uniref:translation initiation factor IF-2-like n=1 Tax=Amphibalanus amphitrite TaxID=1232801 RepID=UPI001C925450|nr:translation initiation factor IF-2-like [Amphibalanus amphitrite]